MITDHKIDIKFYDNGYSIVLFKWDKEDRCWDETGSEVYHDLDQALDAIKSHIQVFKLRRNNGSS